MMHKKCMSLLLAGALAFGAAAAAVQPEAHAAFGGARISAPRVSAPKPAAPKLNKPAAPSANAGQKPSPNQKDYAPSKSAKDLSKEAPAAKAGTAASAAASSTRWGSMMRSIGLFAGGMFLGSLLGGLFGMEGAMADFMGLLMNVLLLGMAFMALRWLWNRFRGAGRTERDGLAQRGGMPLRNFSPMQAEKANMPTSGTDYEPKRTADLYRNR